MSRKRDNISIDEALLPDGGWGWMVVLGVALTNTFNQSLVSVFGLLFGEHLESMGQRTSGVSLVSNISNMVTSFSGLVIGPLLKRYSCRLVTLCGTLLTSVGLIMSSFSSTIGELIFFYSILTGIGLGLIYPATFVAIKGYFSTKRGAAVGVAMAGTGLGQMLMPQIIRILLEEFGFPWTTRIIGALCLNGVAGALLFQPVRWHLKSDNCEITESIVDVESGSTSKVPIIKYTNDDDDKINVNEYASLENVNQIKTDSEKNIFWKKFAEQLDLHLLLDPTFINIYVGIALTYTANMAFGMIFPFFLLETVKFSKANTALCMSLLSGFDIVARLTTPTISRILKISNRNTFMMGALALAAARTAIAEQTDLVPMMIVSLLCGYVRATTVINQNLSVSDHCTDQQLPSALGFTMVAKGLFVITIGQFLGWFRDYTDSFPLFIHATNVLLLLVFFSWGSEFIIKKVRRK